VRIVQITAGAGEGFYCENCVRDAGLVRALGRRDHDALIVPLYLPPAAELAAGAHPEPEAPTRTKARRSEEAPVFFGGIRTYLQERVPLVRRLPGWLLRPLDARPLLRLASRWAGMTDASDLGPMTLSMLRGEHPYQVREMDRLLVWLQRRGGAEAVVLSNALLLGLASRLRRDLRAPVLCFLQNEDVFLDALPEPHRRRAWDLLRRRTADADVFLAPSRYYAEVMGPRLGLGPDRLHVVPIGVEAEAFEPAPAPPAVPTVGFLGQPNQASGLDLLVEAFLQVRRRQRAGRVRLRVAGGGTRADRPFLQAIRRRLAEAGAEDDAEFLPMPDPEAKRRFLASLSVLSVPAREGLAYGLTILEAGASGVPVVEPRAGAFAELVEATGGGLLVEPEDPAALAEGLERLLADPDRARALGRAGREAVLARFTLDRTAERIEALVDTLRRAREKST